MSDLPLFCTVEQAHEDHRVSEAGRRIGRWVPDGKLHEVGTYYPPNGRAGVALDPVLRMLALAEGNGSREIYSDS